MSNPSSQSLKIGLTGGMGCGKSTAGGIFRDLGFAVADSDEIVRQLWEGDAEVKKAATDRWGPRILLGGQGGGIDRRKVAEIVFADSKELEWLEGLLHPLVRRRWQALVGSEPGKPWVVEIPLLFEKSLASEFDVTVCIVCSPKVQEARLQARGLSPVEIAARQARQWPLRQKADRADVVVLNDGSPDFLRRQIVRLAGTFRPKTN